MSKGVNLDSSSWVSSILILSKPPLRGSLNERSKKKSQPPKLHLKWV